MNTIFDAFYVILRSWNISWQYCWSALFQKIIFCTNWIFHWDLFEYSSIYFCYNKWMMDIYNVFIRRIFILSTKNHVAWPEIKFCVWRRNSRIRCSIETPAEFSYFFLISVLRVDLWHSRKLSLIPCILYFSYQKSILISSVVAWRKILFPFLVLKSVLSFPLKRSSINFYTHAYVSSFNTQFTLFLTWDFVSFIT